MGPILFSLFFSIVPATHAQLKPIGAAAAVGGKVAALAPGAQQKTRNLMSGKPVYFKDSITTGPRGKLQVMLQDETIFTLGPDSEMLMDEFVYDPFDTGANKVAARVTKGVFRFVTGKIARKKPSSMKIKLPSGTMGIRGTIAAGRIDGNRTIVALLGPGLKNNAGERPGSITVTNAGITVTVKTPGWGVIIEPGKPPSPPFLLSPKQLSEVGPVSAKGAEKKSGSTVKETSPSKSSPSEEAGQTTAAAGGGLETTETVDDIEDNSNSASSVAAQNTTTLLDGVGTWDEVRTIETGVGHYSQTFSGAFSHTTCSQTCSGTGDISIGMNIDFGNRTYGGAGESVSFSASLASDSASIPSTPFGSLTGFASIDLNALNSNFLSGSKIELLNKNGLAAQEAKVTIIYNNGSDAGSGSGTAPLKDGNLGL